MLLVILSGSGFRVLYLTSGRFRETFINDRGVDYFPIQMQPRLEIIILIKLLTIIQINVS